VVIVNKCTVSDRAINALLKTAAVIGFVGFSFTAYMVGKTVVTGVKYVDALEQENDSLRKELKKCNDLQYLYEKELEFEKNMPGSKGF
jgi:hypothetical protein